MDQGCRLAPRSRLRRVAVGLAAVSAAAGLALLGACNPTASASAAEGPAPAGLQTAILSGGCFWGVQGVFEHVRGVKRVIAGYTGGAQATASYDLVSTGVTGHAESVRITFDPKVISYAEVLRIFFAVATDPTEVNEQGPDHGTQYRSEVFYADADQQRIALATIAQLNRSGVYGRPIATRVDPAGGFYRAEAYHQDYLVRHPEEPYIATFDLPKVAALARQFPADYVAAPVTVFGDS